LGKNLHDGTPGAWLGLELNLVTSNRIVGLRRTVLLPLFAVFAVNSLFAQGIDGGLTLSSNTTFTSLAPSLFTISDKNDVFNLQSYTAAFSGTGNFEVQTRIEGSGSVFIDMTDSAKVVEYLGPGNTYSGLTTVRSGTLLLNSSDKGDSISGDLYIGGGPNPALVSRPARHNRELIADTSTITIAANGTLEFNRMDTGNSQIHSSAETFAHLIMDGGTLLNSSENYRNTEVTIGTVTLLASSVWDLGVAMTMSIGDVANNMWTSDAVLTIKDWSETEPIYVANISEEQLSQIRFDTPQGLLPAIWLPDTQIVPGIIVPEASTLVLVPALILSALWPEIRQRVWRKKKH
jgi:hypothetical protein